MQNLGVELILHPVNLSAGHTNSVFADAARRVLEAAPLSEVRLVSPYVGHAVIAPLVDHRPFRLVTDLAACLGGRADAPLISLIGASCDRIRHLDLVHAKIVLTDSAAFFGSANLTEAGFAERDELGCLTVDTALVQALNGWFERLWSAARPIAESDVAAWAEWGRRAMEAEAKLRETEKDVLGKPPEPFGEGRSLGWMRSRLPRPTALPPTGPRGNLGSFDVHDWDELVARVRQLAQSRGEAERALSLLAHALQVSGLDVDDRRLHLNFGKRPIRLSITINQRHVAWCLLRGRQAEFGFILSDRDVADRAARQIPGAYADCFRRNGHDDTPTLHVPVSALARVSDVVISNWEKAISAQVARRRADGSPHTSSFLRFKRPFLYHVLADASLRSNIVNEAHPLGCSKPPNMRLQRSPRRSRASS